MDKDFDFYLQKIVKQIAKKYKPEKIILFGSATSGKRHKWSDADLAVIKKTNKRFYDRIGDVLKILRPVDYRIPVDVLVYTPEEFQKMTSENYFVKNEIVGKGRVVYE